MGIFSFIETFFFLSLAISFVLILLLVYHFKQRISLLEQKSDTMITIINDIAKEMSVIKCNCNCNCSSGGNPFSAMFGSSASGVCMMPSSFEMFKPRDVEEVVELIPQQNDDDDEDDDNDEDEDDDDDDDGNDEDEYEEPLTKIVVSDNDETFQVNITVDESVQEVCEIHPEMKKTEEVEASEETYRKMSLPVLKQLVLSKELCTDSSKMKKPELIQLLIGTYGSSKTSLV
jgi:hypothetical protein